MTIKKVTLAEKFTLFDERWSPKRVATVDNYEVKVAKVEGEFVWHHHDDVDELFLVVSGTLRILLRDGEVVLNPGELVVIPRGVEHKPTAEGECHIVLFERQGTVNTGSAADSALTAEVGEL